MLKPSEQGVDLFEGFMVWQFVEQFEYRALRRRQRQGPVPLAPIQFGYVAAAKARHVQGLAFVDIPFDAADAFRNRVIFEEPLVVVIDKCDG